MTDIKLIDLPYEEALINLYPAFRSLPYPILLDSNHSDFPETRYDILVADPIATVTALDNQFDVQWRGEPVLSIEEQASPFTWLQEFMRQANQLPWAQGHSDLPFIGGLLGYFGYESGHFLEKLPNTVVHDIPLPDLQVGVYGWALISLHQQRKTLLIITPWCQNGTEREILARLSAMQNNATPTFTLGAPFESNMSASQYQHKFQQVQEYILAGDCYQVNLAQRFSAPCQGDPFVAYQTLRQTCPTPFSAYMDLGENKAILSHSPERFLLCDQGVIETKPIKGTRPRGATPQQDQDLAMELLQSEKDRAENLMIVDLLRNDLGRSCVTGSIEVPKLFDLESYANVHHLVSTVIGRIELAHQHVEVFSNSFPGGSITGAPKIRAMEIIDELEPHERSAYCGSIAYFSVHGQMDSSITIRTLVSDGKQIHCWAGGGLVADSNCEAEYQETFTKVGHLTHTLEQGYLR